MLKVGMPLVPVVVPGRNRLHGTIEKILSGKVVSEVVIRTAVRTVTSIIVRDDLVGYGINSNAMFAVF